MGFLCRNKGEKKNFIIHLKFKWFIFLEYQFIYLYNFLVILYKGG
ncbi:hypothetical protein CHCC20331_1824 [Bacillus paralicheniformis]|nr:hypothetical protein CHCC20331_1824 [Bacillus paralicheniformis]